MKSSSQIKKIIASVLGLSFFVIVPLLASATTFTYSLSNDGNKTVTAGSSTTAIVGATVNIMTPFYMFSTIKNPSGTVVDYTGYSGQSSLKNVATTTGIKISYGTKVWYDGWGRYVYTTTNGAYFPLATLILTSPSQMPFTATTSIIVQTFASTTPGVYTVTSTSTKPQTAVCYYQYNPEAKKTSNYTDMICGSDPLIVPGDSWYRTTPSTGFHKATGGAESRSYATIAYDYATTVCGAGHFATGTVAYNPVPYKSGSLNGSIAYYCTTPQYVATPTIFTVTVGNVAPTISYDPVTALTSATSTCNGTSTPVILNWTAPSNTNYVGFFVYRSDRGTTTPIATIDFVNGTIAKTYRDDTATTTGSYTYYVSAAYVGGESTKSSTTIAVSTCSLAVYSCGGVVPAGFSQCTGAASNLTQNLTWSETPSASSCSSAPKCSYYPTGVTYACTNVPTLTLHQTLQACRVDSASGLTADTPWASVSSAASCSPTTKCQYYIKTQAVGISSTLSLKIADSSATLDTCTDSSCSLANIAQGKNFSLRWANENDTDTDYTCAPQVTTSSGASASSYFASWINTAIGTVPVSAPQTLANVPVGSAPVGYYVFTISCAAKQVGLSPITPASATLHVFQSRTTEQ